jgi:pSer/pThr/pTyr-binding forkhead associated (FHA) protein
VSAGITDLNATTDARPRCGAEARLLRGDSSIGEFSESGSRAAISYKIGFAPDLSAFRGKSRYNLEAGCKWHSPELAMFGQLVPCGGGAAIPLRHRRGLVGRAPECDIPLPIATVSAKHCLLELRDGIWVVSDLASRNGIRINGIKCREGNLPPGSRLSVAECCFVLDYAVSAGEPAVDEPEARDLNAPVSAVAPIPTLEENFGSPQSPSQSGVRYGELVPCGGGAAIPLKKMQLVVGRSPACDIVIEVPVVSSKHCRLDFQEGFWHVRDLGSRNGIRVDGRHQSAKYLKPGAILSIAEQRFQIVYMPTVPGPPPDEAAAAVVVAEAAVPAAPDADEPAERGSGSCPKIKDGWVQGENVVP